VPRPTNPNQTLPQPELNPLLNPLLGDHMGRWAEVYFTNPPERRDQAVIELLRELEGESQTAFTDNSERTVPVIPRGNGPVCAACGQEQPKGQKYCGMCGEELRTPDFRTLETRKLDAMNVTSRGVNPELEDNAQSRNPGWPERGLPNLSQKVHNSNSPGEGRTFAAVPSTDASHSDREARRPTFQSAELSNAGPSLMPEYEPESYRYRVYLGVALAILLSIFIYMAWRSTLAGASSTHPLPQAVPASTPTAELAAKAAKASTSKTPSHTNPPAADSATTQHPPKGTGSAPQKAGRATVAPTVAAAVPASMPASPASSQGNGAEELAIAQSYLQGTAGKARDDGEAAKWLWKSVAKHNDTAALLLSDLYLRGNGVGKNCDQARLLLDAAARKGIAGAADRLRNLQAFSCP
jgi:hypothetical protein